MIEIISFFFISFILVVYGAMAMSTQADLISKKSKRLSSSLVGILLMASMTSAPEFFSAVTSGFIGNPSLAMSNIFGSNITNIFFLALLNFLSSYLIFSLPFDALKLKKELYLFFSLLLNTLILLLFIIIFNNAQIPVWFYFVPIFINLFLYYKTLSFQFYFHKKLELRNPKTPDQEDLQELEVNTKESLSNAYFKFMFWGVIIFFSSILMAYCADKISLWEINKIPLGGSFVGFLFLSFCTSLPEFISAGQAIRLKNFDLAIGNIYGSNLFNLMIYSFAELAFLYSQKGSLDSPKSLLHMEASAIPLLGLLSILVTLFTIMDASFHLGSESKKKNMNFSLMILFTYIASLYVSYSFR